jgi:UDPglucose 6-dehydrogenase
VARVLKKLNDWKIRGKHVIIGCTVMPGYCKTVASLLMADTKDCTISYNPEFICQGDIINGQLYPEMCLIGEGSKEAGDILEHHAKDIASNNNTICRMSTTP